MLRTLTLLLAMTIATPLIAQNFDSEGHWRDALTQAQKNKSTGKKLLWSGVAFMGGGIALASMSFLNPTTKSAVACVGISCVSSYQESTNWGFVGPGVGMFGWGVTSTIWGSVKSGSAGKDIERLRDIGSQKGWRVNLMPRKHGLVQVAYNW